MELPVSVFKQYLWRRPVELSIGHRAVSFGLFGQDNATVIVLNLWLLTTLPTASCQ